MLWGYSTCRRNRVIVVRRWKLQTRGDAQYHSIKKSTQSLGHEEKLETVTPVETWADLFLPTGASRKRPNRRKQKKVPTKASSSNARRMRMANERFAAQERQPKTVSEEDLILRSRRGRTIRIRALAAKAMAKKWKREDQPDPKDLAESQTRPDAAQWLAAYLAESAGFWKDEAGVYVDKIPHGKRSNYSRLIFHSSYDAFGAKKYKCRLVFGGNTQRAVTYGETFAPTAHTETN